MSAVLTEDDIRRLGAQELSDMVKSFGRRQGKGGSYPRKEPTMRKHIVGHKHCPNWNLIRKSVAGEAVELNATDAVLCGLVKRDLVLIPPMQSSCASSLQEGRENAAPFTQPDNTAFGAREISQPSLVGITPTQQGEDELPRGHAQANIPTEGETALLKASSKPDNCAEGPVNNSRPSHGDGAGLPILPLASSSVDVSNPSSKTAESGAEYMDTTPTPHGANPLLPSDQIDEYGDKAMYRSPSSHDDVSILTRPLLNLGGINMSDPSTDALMDTPPSNGSHAPLTGAAQNMGGTNMSNPSNDEPMDIRPSHDGNALLPVVPQDSGGTNMSNPSNDEPMDIPPSHDGNALLPVVPQDSGGMDIPNPSNDEPMDIPPSHDGNALLPVVPQDSGGTELRDISGILRDSTRSPPVRRSSGNQLPETRQIMISFEDRRLVIDSEPTTVDLGPKDFETRMVCPRGIVSVAVEEIIGYLFVLRPSIASSACRVTWHFPLLEDYELLLIERRANAMSWIAHDRKVPLIEYNGNDWVYLRCTPVPLHQLSVFSPRSSTSMSQPQDQSVPSKFPTLPNRPTPHHVINEVEDGDPYTQAEQYYNPPTTSRPSSDPTHLPMDHDEDQDTTAYDSLYTHQSKPNTIIHTHSSFSPPVISADSDNGEDGRTVDGRGHLEFGTQPSLGVATPAPVDQPPAAKDLTDAEDYMLKYLEEEYSQDKVLKLVRSTKPQTSHILYVVYQLALTIGTIANKYRPSSNLSISRALIPRRTDRDTADLAVTEKVMVAFLCRSWGHIQDCQRVALALANHEIISQDSKARQWLLKLQKGEDAPESERGKGVPRTGIGAVWTDLGVAKGDIRLPQ
ncbi:uncharacterized protein STEHIDRAFT_153377 [Stereum hirsutum FP-91666 SS1]|uniref:uncharacterized protein n=1 Tax=Stereum hirsutum (strain FP-91666) TaxID=721885 RepID=UPI000440FAAF|nr:uncharacterized protein STEHIDRAFT_153377 [Stereum hirsutum FP-91666 SS1]EIM89516.1 hypothetical protein STEHIDRAFT_153377 [Stereum hirsutum FP-91666 SS1]